ncbi:MAG: elongation factor Ts [Cyclobacteriaceae bacterium]|nr:elongation factor Ts [Cyclobacteriaceae bacterium]
MAISAQDVNKLRKMTGAGMMDCKKALTEANGDFEKAIEILRKKGQKISTSRADKEVSEGSIFIKNNGNDTRSVLIALNCETDFVAKNDEFRKLGELIVQTAAKNNPSSVDELLQMKADQLTVNEKIVELMGKIGEKIEISAYETMEGETVVSYIHANNKLGVLVSLKGTDGKDVVNAGKDVAMQIAAMSPVAVDKDDVPKEVVDKEIEIGREQAREEGKPEEMLEKIALGKLNKFYKEYTLLNQQFVKDNSITVGKYLDNVKQGLTVKNFKRIAIG